MTKIEDIARQMARDSKDNPHDIDHFMNVWGFARIIGIMENLDEKDQRLLEIAAITHDIACPLCREKYGHAGAKEQEKEGPALVREFLGQFALEPGMIDRVAYVVGRHHTYQGVDGPDWQTLLEADFIVNMMEANGKDKTTIPKFRDSVFKTRSGRELLDSLFPANS